MGKKWKKQRAIARAKRHSRLNTHNQQFRNNHKRCDGLASGGLALQDRLVRGGLLYKDSTGKWKYLKQDVPSYKENKDLEIFKFGNMKGVSSKAFMLRITQPKNQPYEWATYKRLHLLTND
ncbi:hypothetical protein KY320_01585 [Candidatus Woesearchaeota archaeon]|nr:hypothetical protein [Candidatus Woesearchaeota archaeon]